MQETARIREKEETAACRILSADLSFLNLIDQSVYADEATCRVVAGKLMDIRPEAVFTMWPIDTHPDHSAVSEICRKALFLSQLKTELYYFPADIFVQANQFDPDFYVDISAVIAEKNEIICCHSSQNPDNCMAKSHKDQARILGIPARLPYAEVFKGEKKTAVGVPCFFDCINKPYVNS